MSSDPTKQEMLEFLKSGAFPDYNVYDAQEILDEQNNVNDYIQRLLPKDE